jgi:Glycosyl transferase family 11
VVFVAVHIRRADMLDDYNVVKGFTVADQAYLERAVSYMTDRLRNSTVVYVVSGDGLDWATRHFQLAVDAATRGKSHVTVDYAANPSKSTTTTSSLPESSKSSTTSTLTPSLNLSVRAPAVDNVNKIVIVFTMGYSGEVDLAILSKCNHTIMTVGTYGWWAGFLSGGITTYYKDFPRQNSYLSSTFSKEDFFPPHWIAL